MKKVVLILAISLICCFSVIAQTVNSKPETTIQGFYSLYIKEINKNKFPLTEQPAKLKTFITARCYNENKRTYDRNEFDADYFIAAQDFDVKWSTNNKISNLKINGSTATATVNFFGSNNFNHKLKVKLLKQKGVWKIDIIDPIFD